jgi:hypothetical protein
VPNAEVPSWVAGVVLALATTDREPTALVPETPVKETLVSASTRIVPRAEVPAPGDGSMTGTEPSPHSS